jgi:hypothetical protein
MVVAGRQRQAPAMTAQIVDLSARRTRGEQAVARVAAAPVRHVPVEFLAALACVDVGDLRDAADAQVLRLAR